MLLNLLTNACKYTDKGSIDVRVSLVASNASEKTESFPGLRAKMFNSHSQSAVTDVSIVTGGRSLQFEVIDTGACV